MFMPFLKNIHCCFVLLGVVVITLSGCTEALTGASLAYDRYHVSQSVSDHWLDFQAEKELKKLQAYPNSNVSASVVDRVILLTGQVSNPEARARAARLVNHLPEIKRVINQITVGAPATPWQKTHDCWITTKIKSKLYTIKQIDPTKIKVITEKGVVYLMGTVSKHQAEIAAEQSKQTDGVQEVVTIFQFIYIDPRNS